MTGKSRWKSLQLSVALLAALALSVDGYAEGKNFNGFKHSQRMRQMKKSREKTLAQLDFAKTQSSQSMTAGQSLKTNGNLQTITPNKTMNRAIGSTPKFGGSLQTTSNLKKNASFNRSPKANPGGLNLTGQIPLNKGNLNGAGMTAKTKSGSFGAFEGIAKKDLAPVIGKPNLQLDPNKIVGKGGLVGEAGKLPVDKVPLDPGAVLPELPEKAPEAGGEGGGGAAPEAPADPVLEKTPHNYDHDPCYWDVHFCHPHFHSHCWNPTLGCYQVWIYRNDVWVYETVYDLDVLSTQVTLANIALSEPVPYEFVEKLEDGTLIERLGTYWTNPNSETSGREEWRMLDLGPAIEDQLTNAGALLKTPLGFEGTNQPAEFTSTEQQEDGTTMNRAGSWWVEPNGEPRGLDNWAIVAMGPVISVHIQNKVAPYVE